MNESARPLGGRLPLAGPATLTPAQRELYDQLIGSWVVFTDKLGIRSTTEDGRLIGPFNAFLLHPEVTAKLLEFQATRTNPWRGPPDWPTTMSSPSSAETSRKAWASTRSSLHGSLMHWQRATTSTTNCIRRPSRLSEQKACSTSPP